MTRRKFTREFKTEAVRLVTDRGVAVAVPVNLLIQPFDTEMKYLHQYVVVWFKS